MREDLKYGEVKLMSRINYDIDRDFGKNWSGRNSDREYHLIDKSDFFWDGSGNSENRLGELSSSKSLPLNLSTSTFVGVEFEIDTNLAEAGIGLIPLPQTRFSKILLGGLKQLLDITVTLKHGVQIDNRTGENARVSCAELTVSLGAKYLTTSKLEKSIEKFLSGLNKVKIESGNGGISNEVSLKAGAFAETNNLLFSNSFNYAGELNSSNGFSRPEVEADLNIGKEIASASAGVSIRGCMTLKDTGRYGADLLPIPEEF